MSAADSLYKFIEDVEQVRMFYDKQIQPFNELPYLSFILLPTARRKNWPTLSRSQMVTNTRTFSSQKPFARFLEELKRYEIREGLYVDNRTGEPLPTEALIIYITLDPMNEIRGYYKLQGEMNDRLEKMIINTAKTVKDDPPSLELPKLDVISTYKSCLHSCPERIFKKLDVDTKEPDKILKLREIINQNNIKLHLVIETKNGFHVVIVQKNYASLIQGINKVSERILYEFVESNKDWVTIEKNALLVIPGTYQAGYLSKIVEW